ncbi:MAG: hypothetical protein LBP36_01295 [Oscillospiraceae bacterium]|jgi:hypothetical protein|nr:hypothetical protein [Oscillospiraceae bacterium]
MNKEEVDGKKLSFEKKFADFQNTLLGSDDLIKEFVTLKTPEEVYEFTRRVMGEVNFVEFRKTLMEKGPQIIQDQDKNGILSEGGESEIKGGGMFENIWNSVKVAKLMYSAFDELKDKYGEGKRAVNKRRLLRLYDNNQDEESSYLE